MSCDIALITLQTYYFSRNQILYSGVLMFLVVSGTLLINWMNIRTDMIVALTDKLIMKKNNLIYKILLNKKSLFDISKRLFYVIINSIDI